MKGFKGMKGVMKIGLVFLFIVVALGFLFFVTDVFASQQNDNHILMGPTTIDKLYINTMGTYNGITPPVTITTTITDDEILYLYYWDLGIRNVSQVGNATMLSIIDLTYLESGSLPVAWDWDGKAYFINNTFVTANFINDFPMEYVSTNISVYGEINNTNAPDTIMGRKDIVDSYVPPHYVVFNSSLVFLDVYDTMGTYATSDDTVLTPAISDNFTAYRYDDGIGYRVTHAFSSFQAGTGIVMTSSGADAGEYAVCVNMINDTYSMWTNETTGNPNITVDNDIPLAVATGPAISSIYNFDISYTFTPDPLPSSGLANVTLWYNLNGDGWMIYDNDPTPGDGIFSIDVTALGDGFYDWYFIAYDKANNCEAPIFYAQYTTEVITTAPTFSANYTSFNSTFNMLNGTYYPNNNLGFQINFTDKRTLDTIQIISNHTGTDVNYTYPIILNMSNEMFYINLTNQPAMYFEYRWMANDTSGNVNITDIYNFEITKNTSVYPQITNITPSNTTYYSSYIWANVTTNLEPNTYLPDTDYCYSNMNGGANQMMTNATGNWYYRYNSPDYSNSNGISYTCYTTDRGNYTVNSNTTLIAYNFTVWARYLTINSFTSCGDSFEAFNYYAINTTGSKIVGTGRVGVPITNIPYGNVQFQFQNDSSTYFNSTVNYTITAGREDDLTAYRYKLINVSNIYDEVNTSQRIPADVRIYNATNVQSFTDVFNFTSYYPTTPFGTGVAIELSNSSGEYALRNYYLDVTTCTDFNDDLYMLSYDEGQYVMWHVYTQIGTAVSGATVTAEKWVDTAYVTVETENTDGSGTATTWLNPDTIYRITVTASGYTSYTALIRPSGTDYSIFLGESIPSVGGFMYENMFFKWVPQDYQVRFSNDTQYQVSINYTINSYDSLLANFTTVPITADIRCIHNSTTVYLNNTTSANGETFYMLFNVTVNSTGHTIGNISVDSKINCYSSFSKTGFLVNGTQAKSYSVTDLELGEYTWASTIAFAGGELDEQQWGFIAIIIAIVVGLIFGGAMGTIVGGAIATTGTMIVLTALGLLDWRVPLASVIVLISYMWITRGR